MRSLTITFTTKAELAKELTDTLAELCGTAGAITSAPKETPKKEAKKEAPKQEDIDLGGGKSANDELDDLLGGGPAAEPEGPSEDDMKAELRNVLNSKGKDIVEKILRKHGAIKVQDVPAEERAKVIETCKAVLAKK